MKTFKTNSNSKSFSSNEGEHDGLTNNKPIVGVGKLTPRTIFSNEISRIRKDPKFLLIAKWTAIYCTFALPVVFYLNGNVLPTLHHELDKLIGIFGMLGWLMICPIFADFIAKRIGIIPKEWNVGFDLTKSFFQMMFVVVILFAYLGLGLVLLLSFGGTASLQHEHPNSFSPRMWNEIWFVVYATPWFVLYLFARTSGLISMFHDWRFRKQNAKEVFEIMGWNDSPALLEMHEL